MNRKAFTLIELLVVISIISLLSSVVLASLNSAREKGRIAAGRHFSGNVFRVAAEQAVALWDFEECAGTTAADRSGNGNNGTFTGSPTWPTTTQSGTGCALGLSGTSQYMSAGNSTSANVTGSLTVSAWVRFNALSAGSIASKWGAVGSANYSWLLFANLWNAGRVDFLVSGNGTSYGGASSAAGAVATGKWYFITGVYDGTSASLYIDGALVNRSTSSIPSSLRVSSAALAVGADYDNGGAAYRFLNGSVDNVYIFSKALVAEDVQSLYASERSRFLTDNSH